MITTTTVDEHGITYRTTGSDMPRIPFRPAALAPVAVPVGARHVDPDAPLAGCVPCARVMRRCGDH